MRLVAPEPDELERLRPNLRFPHASAHRIGAGTGGGAITYVADDSRGPLAVLDAPDGEGRARERPNGFLEGVRSGVAAEEELGWEGVNAGEEGEEEEGGERSFHLLTVAKWGEGTEDRESRNVAHGAHRAPRTRPIRGRGLAEAVGRKALPVF